LRGIVNGKIKSIDVDWWRAENDVGAHQLDAKLEKEFKKKLDKIKAMADPARNPNEHQRRSAEAVLAKFQAAGPAKATRAPSAPGLEEYDRERARRRRPHLSLDELLKARTKRQGAPMRHATRAINTTKSKSKTEPVNTPAPKKPRTADRHREPNRDRHSPGYMREYMREYMRRRRAAVARAARKSKPKA
jgi:hypothetical protein